MRPKLRTLNAAVTRRTYRGAKAATYDRDRWREDKWRREHEAVSEFLSGATGTVLDIPVGTGRFLPLYARLGLKATGVDISPDMLNQARCKDGAHLAELMLGDIFDCGFADRSFDTVVCIRLLNLITQEEMQAALTELGRVAAERIVLSIRTGDAINRKNRSWTHTHAAFNETVERIGMHAVAERIAHRDAYRVVLLERWP